MDAQLIDPLLEIMRLLRDPETGCEWDKVQTFSTIAPYTIEEAYEVADAIDRDDMLALRDELGDLLLQVVFHSQIAADTGSFDFQDVVTSICEKMTRRHPHIFGEADQSPGWEQIKADERKHSGQSSALDGVALALPALLRAQKIQKRAARVGFDWPDKGPVKDKLLEELDEVEAAGSAAEVHEEIGDLLFSAVNLARHYEVDAERALSDATEKFTKRFNAVESNIDKDMQDMSLDELEVEWQKAKISLGAT
ncbi:MAG: nucleoside triphosphate pyrophosphohydrolase [Sphingomonadales bacterium]|nr:nucleoside triphosphate pyrophosphohydrolase [Sphingomonadales bacterium]NCO50322.1 nucleoside triphosphate pyrophosphohydrolase [Sphingomonadales bacterium]NCP00315.1 nucleoside triphosphate pyrophosphohydrolase [Sphingomonadales bacterium]NCP26002.1 nucleoside triphosphate pyrophosphohydrolase [Sphingomonadales bacterium]NCP44590.1 nucleoside triphosphate pyrophosphohydrolase [Sphingomonadales bacterium]